MVDCLEPKSYIDTLQRNLCRHPTTYILHTTSYILHHTHTPPTTNLFHHIIQSSLEAVYILPNFFTVLTPSPACFSSYLRPPEPRHCIRFHANYFVTVIPPPPSTPPLLSLLRYPQFNRINIHIHHFHFTCSTSTCPITNSINSCFPFKFNHLSGIGLSLSFFRILSRALSPSCFRTVSIMFPYA